MDDTVAHEPIVLEDRTFCYNVNTMADFQVIFDQLKDGLRELYGDRIEGLRLFGSYARNENVAGSDVDLALVLDDFDEAWTEIERTGTLVAKLSLDNNIVISLLPVRSKDWQVRQSPLLLNIRRESVLL